MNIHTENSTTKVTRNHLSFEDRVAIVNFMKKKLRKLENNKYVYVEGFNDELVAKRFKGKATLINIINVRKEIFGPLGQYPRVKRKKEMKRAYENDIQILNARVAQLEYQVNTLLRSYFVERTYSK